MKINLPEKDLSMLGMIGIVGLCAWQIGHGLWGEWWLTYWQYAPNRYRLWEQMTLWLANGSGTIALAVTLVSWVIFMSLAYLVIRPVRHDPILYLWLGWLCWWGYVQNAPVYLLLAVISRWRHTWWVLPLLIPLVLVKEACLPIVIVFLFYSAREQRGETIIWSVIACGAYAAVRLAIGEFSYYPTTAPFFTPPYLFMIINQQSLFTFAVDVLCMLVLLIFSIMLLGHWKLWAIAAIPNILFAVPWEPQLWLPVVILLSSSVSRRSPIRIPWGLWGKDGILTDMEKRQHLKQRWWKKLGKKPPVPLAIGSGGWETKAQLQHATILGIPILPADDPLLIEYRERKAAVRAEYKKLKGVGITTPEPQVWEAEKFRPFFRLDLLVAFVLEIYGLLCYALSFTLLAWVYTILGGLFWIGLRLPSYGVEILSEEAGEVEEQLVVSGERLDQYAGRRYCLIWGPISPEEETAIRTDIVFVRAFALHKHWWWPR